MHLSEKQKEHFHSHNHLDTNRIEALGDAAFAIVMTLLAIELNVPEIASNALGHGLVESLFGLWPMLVSYFISFIVLGIFWVGHHNQFNYIEVTDRWLIWINLVFLMFVALIPFSTAFLGTYFNQQVSIILYGGNLTIIGLIHFVHWWYATKNAHLVEDNISKKLVKKTMNRILLGPKIFIIAILASFFSVMVSLLLFFAVILCYIFPGPLDKFWEDTKAQA